MPLTKDEIRSLLSDIENERVERTLSTDNTKKMSEAICSSANDIRNTKKPGYFLIGADDDGNLDGQTFTDEQLRSYAGLRNSGTILPPPAMMVYKESFPEGEVAVIEVQPSEDTPVRYKGVIWIRIGARKAEANTEEERILTEKGQIHSSSFEVVRAVRPRLMILMWNCSRTSICQKLCRPRHWQRISARLSSRWHRYAFSTLGLIARPTPGYFCSDTTLNISFPAHTFSMLSLPGQTVPQRF